MSIKIIKQGFADSIQDSGRFGYQHLGINPNGAMDMIAAQTANMLVENNLNDAVIELHFPASAFLFEQQTMIALSGADFSASINDMTIPINTPVIVQKSCMLQFKKIKEGARCYLAVKGGINISKWLGSYSTNLKANAGGYSGRYLHKNDVLNLNNISNYSSLLKTNDCIVLNWKADTKNLYKKDHIINIIKGNEYDWLNESSKQFIKSSSYIITSKSDRMGYRMKNEKLIINNHQQLISSAVTKGTIQLLPDGQLIILMADHQTTGGYPRIAHVIIADISSLAQYSFNSPVQFNFIEQEEAEDLFYKQYQYLQQLQNACTFRLQEYLLQHDID